MKAGWNRWGVSGIYSLLVGLLGCPYARWANGNVATEDVVYVLSCMGIHTGVDIAKLIQAGAYVCSHLGRVSKSKAAVALSSM